MKISLHHLLSFLHLILFHFLFSNLEKFEKCIEKKSTSNYERFNCNNIRIHFWSWNYRGCWHQNLPSNRYSIRALLCSHSTSNNFRSFTVIFCHYLPMSGLDNLRACCLPQKWWPFLLPPLRNRTPILRYPSSPYQFSILTSN